MSHELRTPLNAIAGYSDLLLAGVGGELSEQQRQYVERVRSSQRHLLSIINDILNFARIEAGQLDYDIGPVSLREAVRTVVPMVEPQAAAKQLRIEVGVCADDEVSADRAKVEQILLNLLSNALKFTPEGGQITVGCTLGERTIALQVRDTGIGISGKDLQAIFHPFVQVGRSLSSAQEGTRLGLAISSDLAEGMGGTLSAESEVGKGSTFTLVLPRVKKQPVASS
jgi:signal transduction histidine kinase